MAHETTVSIAADPRRVWDVSVDLPAWPQWTPTVKRAERLDSGPFRVGSSARLHQQGLPPMVWTVTDLEEGSSFSWRARRPGLVMTAHHRFAPQPDGTVLVTLGLDAGGPLGKLLGTLLGGKVDRALGQEAAGLKQHCEQVPPTTP